MGSWGPGLYSNDTAEDVRDTVRAVVRLPFGVPRLVEILRTSFPDAAEDQGDEDHTTFWLVVADQLRRRGIEDPESVERAIGIIDTDQDVDLLGRLGMSDRDLRARRKHLATLRLRLTSPVSARRPKPLQRPQPLVMTPGDVLRFPVTDRGSCLNPYLATRPDLDDWQHGAWSAVLIVECGRAFDYLAWYRPVTLQSPWPGTTPPTAGEISSRGPWTIAQPGTCSLAHHRRLRLETVDTMELDMGTVRTAFAAWPDAVPYAVADVSIANSLGVDRTSGFTTPPPSVASLEVFRR